jgi:hypothetical protein
MRAPPNMPRALLATSIVLSLVTGSTAARAYRPFDGTDADVAALGNFELELGPVHWYSQGESHYLLAPATVLNLGFLPRWELVVDFQNSIGIDQPPGEARDRLLDTDILVKTVLLEGSLQDKGSGPSVAAEFGPLLPEANGEEAFGASLDVITSQHWSWITIHLNSWLELSRGDLRPDWFEGAIIEGDTEAPVRPVSEWYVSYDFGSSQTTVSGLVGGIWKAGESVDLDVGLREASIAGERATEIRLGLTWRVDVWTPAAEKSQAARRHSWLAMAR